MQGGGCEGTRAHHGATAGVDPIGDLAAQRADLAIVSTWVRACLWVRAVEPVAIDLGCEPPDGRPGCGSWATCMGGRSVAWITLRHGVPKPPLLVSSDPQSTAGGVAWASWRSCKLALRPCRSPEGQERCCARQQSPRSVLDRLPVDASVAAKNVRVRWGADARHIAIRAGGREHPRAEGHWEGPGHVGQRVKGRAQQRPGRCLLYRRNALQGGCAGRLHAK